MSAESKWLSVDHDESWVENISSMQPNRIVTISHVKANTYPWTDADEDGSETDLNNYLNYPDKYAPFDFIMIDGRARNACIRKAKSLLRDKGIVLLHDANRPAYQKEWHAYEHQFFLQGYRMNAGGLWLGSPGRPIQEVLDVEYHKDVWDLCCKAGRLRIKC